MARPRPFIPHTAVPLVSPERRIEREWHTLLIEIVRRLPVTGTLPFSAATSAPVVFPAAETSADYIVVFDPSDEDTFWVSAKTTTGFTINTASSFTGTVNWVLIRT